MNNKDMNYIFFIILCIFFIILFHYVYTHIYESINLYNTYEKNIQYIDENVTNNININNNSTDILKQHLHNKLQKQKDNDTTNNETI